MILSIESSCDDSSIAISDIKTYKLIKHLKISQSEHAIYGGVVPELAARLHTTALTGILEEFSDYFDDIKAIAVTNSPGLSPSLLTGISLAKALSISLNKPLIKINHLIAHIYSLFIEKDEILPLGILLVSGGHTLVMSINDYDDYEIISSTTDDSFGESFDKVGKMLGLDYPAGHLIEKMAQNGSDVYNFSIPLQNSPTLNFSFSGLKNQVRLKIQELRDDGILEDEMANICTSFQKTAIAHISQKLKKIFKIHKFKNFGIVGGASANKALISEISKIYDDEILVPKLEFCSDNAAMVGRLGIKKFIKNDFIHYKDLDVVPNLGYKKKFL